MRRIFFFLLFILILTGCERPATITNWSPIEGTQTTVMKMVATETAIYLSTPNATASPTSLPTMEVETLPAKLPHSLKGYELVSWQTDNEWNFTLITGTNREKSFDELISSENYLSENGMVKLTVSGVEEIKQVLGRLPVGESVAWGGMNLSGQVPTGTIYFSYPSQEIMDDILDFTRKNGIHLFTLQEPE